MKKLLALMLAAMMLLSLAACGNNDDNPSGSENNPGTSQSDNQGGENTNNGGSNTNDNDEKDNNAIVIKEISRSFNSNDQQGKLKITFVRPNNESVAFATENGEAAVYGNELPVDGSGFTITEGFTIAKIEVYEKWIFISYNATEENYDGVNSITYTPNSTSQIKTTKGEVIEGFTYELPYINWDI